MQFIRYIPKSYLSWGLGHLARLPLPRPLAAFSVGIFARAYKIDPSLAVQSPTSYRCIGDFFTRDIRPELRPIAAPVVSPVDGTLRWRGNIEADGALPQVKGRTYRMEDLLGGDPLAKRFLEGQAWNFYLSPHDAHHIHSPVAGRIVRTVHVPGKLWPVNNWAIEHVDGLFVANERVITFIESDSGLFAIVMVGATNVGRIALQYTEMETNRSPWLKTSQTRIDHEPGLPVAPGAKIGTFKMGSSVVVLTERKLFNLAPLSREYKVMSGQDLGSLCQDS